MKLIRKTYQAETKDVNENDRTLVVRISTVNPDRSNDVVLPTGMLVENYLRNPVVAAFHRYDQPAIGKTLEVQQTDDGIMAKVQFVPKGISATADQLYEMYKSGFMNAWSIGFIPKKWSERGANMSDGREFQEWELLEYSAVLVPDNPDALTMLRSKGIEAEADKEFTQEVDMNEVKKLLSPVINFEVDTKTKILTIISQNGEKLTFQTSEDYSTHLSELLKADKEMKEGRVLSEKNRSLISGVIEQMNAAIKAMQDLIEATDKEPKEIRSESRKTVLDLTAALKLADQVIGKALRDVRSKGELGTVPDDARVPIVIGKKGGED